MNQRDTIFSINLFQ